MKKYVDRDKLQEFTTKLTNKYKGLLAGHYVFPEMFGAVGDGVTDDTNAFQAALDVGGTIILKSNKVYYIENTLSIKANTTINLNGSKITCTNKHLFYNFLQTDTFLGYNGNGNIIICDGDIVGGAISFIHGENILISNVHFSNCANDHYFEICACKNVIIDKCTFKGMITTSTSQKEYINIDNCMQSNFPHLPDGATFDGTVVDGVLISDCLFDRNGTEMQDAVGKHATNDAALGLDKAKNITIKNCRIINATQESFLFIRVENLTIENCISENSEAAFTIRNSDNVRLISNKTTGLNTQNKLSDCNNVFIINDNLTVGSNKRGYFLSGICENIIYKDSIFTNAFGTFKPINFYGSGTTISNFSAKNNIVKTTSNLKSYYDAAQSGAAHTLGEIDFVMLAINANTKTFTGTENITKLKELNIVINNQTVKITPGVNAYFMAGDVYKVPLVDANDQLYIGTITIETEYKITIDGDLVMNSIWGRN